MKIIEIIKGEVLKYRYNKELKLIPFELEEEIKDFDELLLLQGDFIAKLEDKNKDEIYYYSSISGKYDIFYSNNKICFNFIDAIEISEKLTINNQAKEYFIKHRYYKNEETLFNEIKRVLVGEIITVNKNKEIRLKNILLNSNIEFSTNYKDFKRYFSESVDLSIADENIVLQSSGKDSNLILSFLTKDKNKKKLNTKTLNLKVINPEFSINIMDTFKSEKISKKLDITYFREVFDCSKSNIEDLNDIILKMPLASHLSLNFKSLLKGIDKNFKGNILCGQNADALYNLGPTDQTIACILTRFFLSDFFISSLSDVKGNFKTLKRIVSWIILNIYIIKKKKRLYLPKNSNEYFETFFNAINYLNLSDTKLNIKRNIKDIKSYEVRKKIYYYKLNTYFRGGDSRVVYYSSDFDERIKLIYSTNILVLFFMQLNYSMPVKDILIGKYYIRKYLKELFLEYFDIKGSKIKGKSYKVWCDEIKKTKLFIQIKEVLKIDLEEYSIDEILGMYWVRFIIEKYKNKITNLESEINVK